MYGYIVTKIKNKRSLKINYYCGKYLIKWSKLCI